MSFTYKVFSMSNRGRINQIQKAYQEFIRQTAFRGKVDPEGNLIGTRKFVGYVAAIHEDGELAGTVDVQEFNYEAGDYEFDGAGYHEGVKVCATNVNNCGVLIMPLMYSEVVFVQNPSTQEEYIISWSHAKMVQVKAHEELHFGVIEHEPFNETDDGLEKDFFELEETGKKAITDYDKDSITDEVSVDGEGLTERKTSSQKTIEVGDTKIIIDGSSVTIETSGNVTFKVGGSTIEEKDGEINIKTDTANVKASDVVVDGNDVKVKGSQVTITGGNLTTQGASNTDLNGPFNAIKVCPFSGAPHCGSKVSGT